jgi:NDP-sugar pyrophosphorylase family protein
MVDAREPIAAVYFTGIYINVTHPEDIAKAEELLNEFRTS